MKLWAFSIKFGEVRCKNVNSTFMQKWDLLKKTLSRTHDRIALLCTEFLHFTMFKLPFLKSHFKSSIPRS